MSRSLSLPSSCFAVLLVSGAVGQVHSKPAAPTNVAASVIRPIPSLWSLEMVAGDPVATGGSDGQVGSDPVRFNSPCRILAGSGGSIYVLDRGNQDIRRITRFYWWGWKTVVNTIAGYPWGYGHEFGDVDAGGLSARFSGPADMAMDGLGDIYVVEPTYAALRRIHPDGGVCTLAGPFNLQGNGRTDPNNGPIALGQTRVFPTSVAVRNVGTDVEVYFTESNGRVRVLNLRGGSDPKQALVSTVGGEDGSFAILDGLDWPSWCRLRDSLAGQDGGALPPYGMFIHPRGLAIQAGDGTLYVGDSSNILPGEGKRHDLLRKISQGTITTIGGAAFDSPSHQPRPLGPGYRDGNPGQFTDITSLVLAPSGTLYVLDDGKVRTVAPDGTVTTLIGPASPGIYPRVPSPAGGIQAIGLDGSGNLLVATPSAILRLASRI